MQKLAGHRQGLCAARAPRAFAPRRAPAVKTSALFGFGSKGEKSEKELEKEEAFRVQQEVLARRRQGTWQQEVKERRGKVSRYLNDPGKLGRRSRLETCPLLLLATPAVQQGERSRGWPRRGPAACADAAARQGPAAGAKKEAADAQVPKFGIIVPTLPFGIPDYDIGEERFDLRLPHVDKGERGGGGGWEDQSIANDPLGLKQLGKAFGFGKKEKKEGAGGAKRKGGR
eukprot:scaffold21.g2187.t1